MLFEKILLGLICLSAVILFVSRFVLKRRYDKKNPEPEPILIDYARSFLPVLLIVFLLRAFIVEPFRIPSSSMLPTLEIGDFLLVNKFQYGLRLPIGYQKIVPISQPERGDIIVFRYPLKPKINYIKRVMGLPGDLIEYRSKRLYINKEEIKLNADGEYSFEDAHRATHNVERFDVSLDSGKKHDLLINPRKTPERDKSWIVPEGHYFAMGDNRDHSSDSRYWGFVPDENIVGKAFFIWFHWDTITERGLNFSRVGQSI